MQKAPVVFPVNEGSVVDGCMAARDYIAVIFHQQVHVVKDHTVKLAGHAFTGLRKPHIHHGRLVEAFRLSLKQFYKYVNGSVPWPVGNI